MAACESNGKRFEPSGAIPAARVVYRTRESNDGSGRRPRLELQRLDVAHAQRGIGAIEDADHGPIVLDDRATVDGLRERLEWLFDDVRDGDVRFLYFSGHGVRLPAYNSRGEPDRLIEALVPHDFDGTRTMALTDRDPASYYHRLPPEARLIMAFDCCHSGDSRVPTACVRPDERSTCRTTSAIGCCNGTSTRRCGWNAISNR